MAFSYTTNNVFLKILIIRSSVCPLLWYLMPPYRVNNRRLWFLLLFRWIFHRPTITLQKRNHWTPALTPIEQLFLDTLKPLNIFNIVSVEMFSKRLSIQKLLLKIRTNKCSFQTIFYSYTVRSYKQTEYKPQTPDKISMMSSFVKSEFIEQWISYSEAGETSLVTVNAAWVFFMGFPLATLRWRHNERDSVSNRQPHDCLFNRLFTRRSKKHQSSASLAFVGGIHRGPENSPHKWPVTRKMFPFDDVIMNGKLCVFITVSLNKMPAILQTIFSNTFPYMEILARKFPGVPIDITQYWFE